jgi:hypothetical protein
VPLVEQIFSGTRITNPVINHVRRRGCNYYKGNICSTSGTRITDPVINHVTSVYMIYHRICNTGATSGADITIVVVTTPSSYMIYHRICITDPVINHVNRRGCNYYKGNICCTSGTRITNPVINHVRRRGCNYYNGNIATSGADITFVVVTTPSFYMIYHRICNTGATSEADITIM